MNKHYLGDGVFIELEDNMIKLTTENGIEITNTIFMESKVYNNLTEWINRLQHIESNKESNNEWN